MRILNLVFDYYPSPGGMQAVVRELSTRWVVSGHTVTVATSRVNQRTDNTYKGVEIVDFDIRGNLVDGIKGDKVEIDRYIDTVLGYDADIVIFWAGQIWTLDLMIPHLSKIKGKKIFVPTNFSMFHSVMYSEYYQKMAGYIDLFDKIVFISEMRDDYKFCNEFVKDKSKFVLIPNGASEVEFLDFSFDKQVVKDKLGIKPNERLVLSVGTHTGIKGHQEMFEVFNRMKATDTVFWILGNWEPNKPWNSGLKNILRNIKGIFKVGCLGRCKYNESVSRLNLRQKVKRNRFIVKFLNRRETVEILRASDMFVLLSNTEGSPIVLFEAMACGVPFVSSDAGNAKEILSWTNAGLVVDNVRLDNNGYSVIDIEDATKKIDTLLSNPELRNKLGKNGFNSWKGNYTWATIAEKYIKVFDELLES